jgi:hypothetical protein
MLPAGPSDHPIQESNDEANVLELLNLSGDRRLIAGPWLDEVGWEVLSWIPLLRWCVNRIPELRERLVVVSRGGVADWYEGISDTYFDVADAYDEQTFARRLTAERASQTARGKGPKGSQATEWQLEIAEWVSGRLGEPGLRMVHPSTAFHLSAKRFVRTLTAPGDGAFHPWRRPGRGPLHAVLPERYVAVRFYRNTAWKGTDAKKFSRNAVRALAETIPVVILNTNMTIDPQHKDLLSGANAIYLGEHMSFRNNLAIQSIAIANAQAFVGNSGGLSYISPYYGVPSVSFWSPDARGAPVRKLHTQWDFDFASLVFNRPGWGGWTARSFRDAPMDELLAPALRE